MLIQSYLECLDTFIEKNFLSKKLKYVYCVTSVRRTALMPKITGRFFTLQLHFKTKKYDSKRALR